jgi:hypothetical protein
MILITYTRHTLADDKKQMDYVKLAALDEVWDWILSLGGRLSFSLTKKKRTLTQSGWEKFEVNPPDVFTIFLDDPRTVITLYRIVSEDGILFENIKHCSGTIVDLVASKCEISKTV